MSKNINPSSYNNIGTRKKMFIVGGWFSLAMIILDITISELHRIIAMVSSSDYTATSTFVEWQYYALAFLFLGPAIVYSLARILHGSPEYTPPDLIKHDSTLSYKDKEDQQP